MMGKRAHLTWIAHGSIEDANQAHTSLTGSLHTLQITLGKELSKTLVIDAWLRSGKGSVEANNDHLPIDPAMIDSLIITHTHNDHIGRLPMIAGAGYDGPILMTDGSRQKTPAILQDSLHVQEQAAQITKERRKSRGAKVNKILAKDKTNRTPQEQALLDEYNITANHHIKQAQDLKFGTGKPLFSQDDINKTLSQINNYEYHQKFVVFSDTDRVQARFLDAWHIYGSAMTLIEIQKQNSKKIYNILRCGDLWRMGNRLFGKSPHLDGIKKQIDLVFMESTYGGRNHPDIIAEYNTMASITQEVFERGGVVLKPNFSQERFWQSLLLDLQLIEQGILPEDTILIADSPLAKELITMRAIDDPNYRKLLHHKNIKRTEKEQTVEELLKQGTHKIFHASGGMLEGGSVMKLIDYFNKESKSVPDQYRTIAQKWLVLLSGYTAEGTLGHVVQHNHNKYNSARVNFSGHIDHQGIIHFLSNKDNKSGLSLRKHGKICLMHGELGAMHKIKDDLIQAWFSDKQIIIPTANGTEYTFPL